LHSNGDQLPAYTITHTTVRQSKGDSLGYHEVSQVTLNSDFPIGTKVREYYVLRIYLFLGVVQRRILNPERGGQFYIPEEARGKLIPGKIIDI
jgi:hypothetical protein